MKDQQEDNVRQSVRERYGKIAKTAGSCCGPSIGISCIPSEQVGYLKEDLAGLPSGADMGLGCGNPHAFGHIKTGETVLDLGSGGGIDCFLAARAVGETGRVIGVDMTADMVSKARDNAKKMGAANVEFRLGEIEHLPVADESVDVILSNCVINLSPDKHQVFKDAYRV
nr:methyltransferase domain-containing protein [Deltaproteobacteria bacterium]